MLAVLALAACTTPLELGERRYQEGDRLAALETWRAVRSDNVRYEAAQKRIADVEREFERLVERYKQRARYYEQKGRLAESILNYRLALKLQPQDRTTLEHVQGLARELAKRRFEARALFQQSMAQGDLVASRDAVEKLRKLDPFSPEVANDVRQVEDALQEQVEALLVRGRRGFSSGRLRNAEQAFRSVLNLDPENESAQGYLSYIAKIRSDDRGVAPALPARFDPAEVDASDAEIRAEGFFQNALAAERSGDPYAAIRYDLAALRSNPVHPRVRTHLASVRRKLEPELEPLIQSGRDAYQEEDLETALDQWRRALLIDPRNEQAREYEERAERLLENLDRLRAESPTSVGAP